MSKQSISFKVVIPSRYGSSRLPGKPLKIIAGKTMIHRVYENAISAGAEETIVATDDERIVSEISKFDGIAMMTSLSHRSGTDRISEVARTMQWQDDAIVVNLQGDEPGIGQELIQMVANALHQNPEADIATVATPITIASDLFNPNVVKVVCDSRQMALYFSRAPIPWDRDRFVTNIQDNKELPLNQTFLRHLGLYAYRVGALTRISEASPSDIEIAESLEQLRAMSMGYKIHISVIDKAPGHGVDTEADLQRVSKAMASDTDEKQ